MIEKSGSQDMERGERVQVGHGKKKSGRRNIERGRFLSEPWKEEE